MDETNVKLENYIKVAFGLFTLLIGSLIVIYHYSVKPDSQIIFNQKHEISEITLINSNFESTPYNPNTNLGYLRWINFEKINFQGEQFHQVGSGSSFIYPINKKSQFVIENIIESKTVFTTAYNFQRTYIKDQFSNEILAYKEWRCSSYSSRSHHCYISSDNSEGWQGQYGALFVRKVLNPKLPIKGAIGVIPYPKTVYSSLTTTNKSMMSEYVKKSLFNCPSDFSIIRRKDLTAMVLKFKNIMFLPANNIKQVYCLDKEIFVISHTFPRDIFLDWFSYSGELLGQFEIDLSTVNTSDYSFVNEVYKDGKSIRLKVSYFNQWPRQQKEMKSYLDYDVSIDTFLSERRHKNVSN